jgi:hypothetical protein
MPSVISGELARMAEQDWGVGEAGNLHTRRHGNRSRSHYSFVTHLIATLLWGMLASAAMAQQQPPNALARANQGAVGVITGMEGDTYAWAGADLTILDDDTLACCPPSVRDPCRTSLTSSS